MTFANESDALPEGERLRIGNGKSSALGVKILSHRIGTREETIL